jgi:hypothetical protein
MRFISNTKLACLVCAIAVSSIANAELLGELKKPKVDFDHMTALDNSDAEKHESVQQMRQVLERKAREGQPKVSAVQSNVVVLP